MKGGQDAFTTFEHAGWQRVADKYDSVWSSLTRQFIPHLISAARVSRGMLVLDVACGIQGDAQALPFPNASFDRVLINFGLLHVSHPEKACAEACRVLKSGSRLGFTVWAGPEKNTGAKIVNDAIQAHADLDVGLREGPPHYLFGESEECRKVLEEAGFDGTSVSYETRAVEWHLPTASYFFEAERDAGVRTAGLLARQSPEKLDQIRVAIENAMQRYARGNEFILPMTAHVVVVCKS